MTDPLRVAVVGCGLAARRLHFPAYAALPDAEVVVVASGRRSTAEEAAKEFDVPRVAERWEDVVDDPEVDAVDVCTPNTLHAPVAAAAARAGKHVLVEKPMATTAEDADAMVVAARDAGVVLAVAHNLRFVPVYEEARRIVAEGAIGRIVGGRAILAHAGPDETWGATGDWFWTEADAGGGAFLDLGVHVVDLVRWIVDEPVVEVAAMSSRTRKPTFADDASAAVLRFDGDALVSVQASWTVRPHADAELVLHGERGTLAVGRGRRPLVYDVATGDEPRRVTPEIPERSPAGDPVTDVVSAVRQGRPPRAPGEEGRASLAVVLAAYEAARTGRTTPVR